MPDFLSTYSLIIEPLSTDGGSPGCSIRVTDAIISKGFLGRFPVDSVCVPCLKRTWSAQTQEEWHCYYEEALRRTIKAMQTSVDSAPTERKVSGGRNLIKVMTVHDWMPETLPETAQR